MTKKIMVTQPSISPYEDYCNEIKDLWETKWLTNNGNKHTKLKEELKKYLGVPNVTLFNNGHMALYNALKVLNLNGEVITTPFSFVSTTHAIVQNNLKPVFCDINEDDYTIDVDKIESLITDKTSAIVAVHVYGNPCNVEKIEQLAQKHNLKVVYDAAHAFGVKYNGKSLLNYGDISMLSFHATKVFNTIEGGALICKDYSLCDKLHHLKKFGIVDEENIDFIGMNCKMNEFQAAMGLCNLRYIDEEIAKRKNVYERYIENLKDVKGIKLNYVKEEVISNYSYFPILVMDEYGLTRDELFKKLEEENIFPRKYFYPLISDCSCYRNEYDSSLTPIAKRISNQVMTLPMYADLELEMVDKICETIKKNSAY